MDQSEGCVPPPAGELEEGLRPPPSDTQQPSRSFFKGKGKSTEDILFPKAQGHRAACPRLAGLPPKGPIRPRPRQTMNMTVGERVTGRERAQFPRPQAPSTCEAKPHTERKSSSWVMSSDLVGPRRRQHPTPIQQPHVTIMGPGTQTVNNLPKFQGSSGNILNKHGAQGNHKHPSAAARAAGVAANPTPRASMACGLSALFPKLHITNLQRNGVLRSAHLSRGLQCTASTSVTWSRS